MAKGLRALMVVAAAGWASAACLTKETSNHVYLDPDGALTWSILHRNVSSDDNGREALDYLSAALRDDHGVTRAFRKLEPLEVSTTVLRAERPYSVLAEARFAGIDFVGQRILDLAQTRGTSTLRRNGDGSVTWMLVVDDIESDNDGLFDTLNDIDDLFDTFTIVLTEGRFLAAQGFKIAADEATILDDDESDESAEHKEGEPIVISLTWTTRD
ncbi:MAG: hypothetical protein A3H97_20540 [Acidobacteria bacterium RIFCSPLOWO2_02_FULL_65_29]|nr:MAG: hypothetical protein A3H97_20540 [Acidobacteria bacterium RIFCSPLOWO2_02_FULL_65_29]